MWARWTILRAVLVALAAAAGGLLAGCGAVAHMPAPTGDRENGRRPPARAVASDALTAAFDRAVALIDELHFAEALARLEQLEPVVVGTGDLELAAACMFWKGFCQEKLSRPAQAALSYRRVLESYPQTRVAEPARKRLESLNLPESMTP